jgi:hypothetical protein
MKAFLEGTWFVSTMDGSIGSKKHTFPGLSSGYAAGADSRILATTGPEHPGSAMIRLPDGRAKP